MRSSNSNLTSSENIKVVVKAVVTAFLLGVVMFVLATRGRYDLGSKEEFQAGNELSADTHHMMCMNELRTKWRGMDERKWQQVDKHIPFSPDAVLGFSDEKTGQLRHLSWADARARAGLKTTVLRQHHSDTSDLKRSGVVKFLYDDNTVVVADLNVCKVTGIYEPTPQGSMDPRVSRGLPTRQQKGLGEDIAFGRKTGKTGMAFTVRVGEVGTNGNPGKGFCSGVILSPTMVLTAKHCVDDLTGNKMEVIAGAAKISDSANRQIRQSAEFVKNWHYDIALVRVSSPFVLNSYVEKVEMLMGYEEVDWTVDASGYGHNEVWSGMSPDRKEGAMKTKSSDFCKNHAPTKFNVDGELCCVGGTSDPNGNTCGGDSGGPLTYTVNNRKALLGVNSWSRTDCWKSGNVDFFVDVAKPDIVSWIVSWVGHFSGHTQPVVYKTNCMQTQWTPSASGAVFLKGSQVVVDCKKAT